MPLKAVEDLKLAPFTDNPAELAASMRRESLRDMCREAGIWRSGNKRALAAGLINWRDRCRARGKAFLTEMQYVSKSKPQQRTRHETELYARQASILLGNNACRQATIGHLR